MSHLATPPNGQKFRNGNLGVARAANPASTGVTSVIRTL